MPHLPDHSPAPPEATMDQLRIPALALDHAARLLADAERDRLARPARPATRRTLADRLATLVAGTLVDAKPSARRPRAEPC